MTAHDDNVAMARSTLGSVWRPPRLAVHFGAPVPLDDLAPERRGDAHRAARRITVGLVPLRAHDPGLPHFRDPTRPVVPGGTAAFPGGRVPPEPWRAGLDPARPG